MRASGAGMGCPDWPLCFGQWIPPTDVDQLPANYQEIYADRGYADTTFNATKTWIEYLNRLLGAFTASPSSPRSWPRCRCARARRACRR